MQIRDILNKLDQLNEYTDLRGPDGEPVAPEPDDNEDNKFSKHSEFGDKAGDPLAHLDQGGGGVYDITDLTSLGSDLGGGLYIVSMFDYGGYWQPNSVDDAVYTELEKLGQASLESKSVISAYLNIEPNDIASTRGVALIAINSETSAVASVVGEPGAGSQTIDVTPPLQTLASSGAFTPAQVATLNKLVGLINVYCDTVVDDAEWKPGYELGEAGNEAADALLNFMDLPASVKSEPTPMDWSMDDKQKADMAQRSDDFKAWMDAQSSSKKTPRGKR